MITAVNLTSKSIDRNVFDVFLKSRLKLLVDVLEFMLKSVDLRLKTTFVILCRY